MTPLQGGSRYHQFTGGIHSGEGENRKGGGERRSARKLSEVDKERPNTRIRVKERSLILVAPGKLWTIHYRLNQGSQS